MAQEHNRQELKPCPFCGGTALMYADKSDVPGYAASATIVCRCCSASAWVHGKTEASARDEAAYRWNRRVTVTA